MPSVQWSRVNHTNPSPYDQIFVLSQDFINRSFREKFNPDVVFQRYNKEAVRTNLKSGQWIKKGSKVIAPEISIHVKERNPAYQILFTLRFKSGFINLRTSPPGEQYVSKEFPLDGWELVFKTRIGKNELFTSTKELSRDDPKYNAYKTPSTSSSPGFRDIVFSLNQLYLDTSDVGAGAGFDASRSNFKGANLDADTLYNLKLFANEWLTTFDERGLNVIGTSLTKHESTPQQRSRVGTFVPSIIDYAAYPWIDPDNLTVETDGLPQNALAILTYTDSRRRSSYAPPGLAHSGVFTNGGAAFCMNRDLFWTHFVLPSLQEINQKTEIFPQWPRRNAFEINYSMGNNPRHRSYSDGYFSWKQQSRNEQPYWSWTGDVQRGATQWAGGHSRYAHDARTSTELTFNAGGQDLQVKGTLAFNAEARTTGSQPWVFGIHSETEWLLKFRIQAVSAGGLQIVRQGDPTVHAKTVKASKLSKGADKNVVNRLLRRIENTTKTYLNGAIKNITQQLDGHLSELHKLVLPGRGVFRFGPPLFNKRGDLLAGLQYLRSQTTPSVIHKLVRDPSNGTADTDYSFEDDDLAAQFKHISDLSQNYPEDEPVAFDEDEQEASPDHYFDLKDFGDRHYLADGEVDFPGPGSGPISHVDWDAIVHGDRPWHEDDVEEHPEKKPDEKPPTKTQDDDDAPVFGITDG